MGAVRTSLPVFLIFSRTVSYGAVPLTMTSCFSREISKEETPDIPEDFGIVGMTKGRADNRRMIMRDRNECRVIRLRTFGLAKNALDGATASATGHLYMHGETGREKTVRFGGGVGCVIRHGP